MPITHDHIINARRQALDFVAGQVSTGPLQLGQAFVAAEPVAAFLLHGIAPEPPPPPSPPAPKKAAAPKRVPTPAAVERAIAGKVPPKKKSAPKPA